MDDDGGDAGALFCRLGFIKKQRCAVCEREYIKDNLPAVVSYRAVERLRETWCEQFGTVMRKDARYAAATKLYDQVRVCVFCFQFFGAQHTDISCWFLSCAPLRRLCLLLEAYRLATSQWARSVSLI